MGDLTSAERAVLQLADSGLQGGAFHNAVIELGYTGQITYWKDLNALIETERALAAYPVLVNRLRRLRTARRAGRGYARNEESS